jgi:hypothetical protein
MERREMNISNVITAVVLLINVCDIEAMVDTPTGRPLNIHKRSSPKPKDQSVSFVPKAEMIQAVLIQGKTLSSFLAAPSFDDKLRKKCPVILDDNLKKALEPEKVDLQKQKQLGSMTGKLKEAVDTAALYEISEDVESVSFELYGDEIGIAANAPI